MYQVKNPREKIIPVRVTQSEYRLIEERAIQHNEKPSSYMRSCATHRNRRKDTVYTRDSKTHIRNMQTSFNMIHQNIDVENQKEKILKEAETLCYLLQ